MKCVLSIIKRELQRDLKDGTSTQERCVGVSEETTLLPFVPNGTNGYALFPAIKQTAIQPKASSTTCTGANTVYQTASCTRKQTVMLAGKRAIVAGFGDVGKGCAFALKAAGDHTFSIDPICLASSHGRFPSQENGECVVSIDLRHRNR